MSEEMNILVLTDEDGTEIEMEYLTNIEYQGETYAILMPLEEDDGEVVILQVEDSDEDADEETYASVEDMETLTAVYELFKEKFKDELDFED